VKKKKPESNKPIVSKNRPKNIPTLTDPLVSTYLREVHRYPLLTREEERALALEYFENKDRESLQKLVTANLRFVVKIAYEYVHYRLKLLDLIQEGNMGLVKAVQDFNPYKDVRLTTYAVWWIRSYIQDYILKNYSLVKIGTTQAQKRLFYRLKQEQRKLEQQGIAPDQRTKLIAKSLNVKEKEVTEMQQRLHQSELSLNTPVFDGEGKEHLDNVADPSEAFDDELADVEQKNIFHEILMTFAKKLEGREQYIFENRLVSEDPVTLQEIGDKFGVTKERARQLEEQIKAKLKDYVEKHYPDFKLLTE